MLLAELVETSAAVAATRKRTEKLAHLVALMRRLAPGEIEIGTAYLSGELPGGQIGVGPALLRSAEPSGHAAEPGLELLEVDRRLTAIATTTGSGSAGARRQLLSELLSSATESEQRFLERLLLGELRQGALEGLLTQAVARAAELPEDAVQRALMLNGTLGPVARAALLDGAAGLDRFALKPLSPVKPMLAQDASDVPDALATFGRAAFEWKLDGARIQAHKDGHEVRIFTRQLNDVTAAVPELAEIVRALPARSMILDGEAIALDEENAPRPFQVTMKRFGRKLDVEAQRRSLPLSSFFFDCLLLDGESLLDRPAGERANALAGALPSGIVVPRLVTDDPAEARAFLDGALERGHEGVVAKALDAGYEAGRRGGSWRKLKPVHTLDLVVLACEWGSGRRQGWLSNLHLGARDPGANSFVMLGKTFKGLTDEMLAWQTQHLLALEIARDEWTVHVRPELVVEVAFGDVQASPRYPAGLALRFARVKRHRPDKLATEADTIDTVRAIHARSAPHTVGS